MNAIAPIPAGLSVAVPRETSFRPALGALCESAWFANASHEALTALSLTAELFSFTRRQRVPREGQWLGAALVVIKGSVRAVRRSDNTRELTLETFRTGDLIADTVLHPDGSIPIDGLVAAETTRLLFIPGDEFRSFLSRTPQAALLLVRDLEKRLHRVKLLASGLATSDVENRLYRLLYNLARDEGQGLGEGTVIARLPTQQDLASRVGACRETVSRIVADLVRQRILFLDGRQLTLASRFFEIVKLAGIA